MWKINQWQKPMSGNLSTTTESSLSTTCVSNARKLEIKCIAIYSETIFLIRTEW